MEHLITEHGVSANVSMIRFPGWGAGVLNGAFIADGAKPDLNGSPAKTVAEKQEQEDVKSLKKAMPQLLACAAKNMILLSYGMSLGFVTIAIPKLSAKVLDAGNSSIADNTTHLRLSEGQTAWFGSINWMMVAVGGIVSGPFAAPWGRKPAMIAVNFCFILGYLIFYFAQSVPVLYLAQAVCGFGGGLLEAPVLTYIAEISQPHLRDALSASTTAVLILGLFIDFCLGWVLHWRTVTLVNIVAPVIAVIALCFVPESPHWLIGKGRIEEAERSLCWLRGWVEPAEVKKEMSLLIRTLSSKKVPTIPSWRQLTRRTFLVPYSIVVFAFFVGHWSGMTPLQTYAVPIFSAVGTPIDKEKATVLIGLVELTGTIACVCLVHYVGKRPLALVSTLGAGICFLVAATYAHLHGGQPPEEGTPYAWVPMAFLVASALISHIGIRILPWMLIGEVYPPEIKGFASGASGCMGYIVGFSANLSFLTLKKHLTLAGTFWLYSAVALFGTVLLFFFLPETEGRPLHEILEHFEGKRDLRSKDSRKSSGAGDPEKWAAENPAMSKSESKL